MFPILVFFSGQVQHKNDALTRLDAIISTRCSHLEATGKAVGFFLEDSMALLFVPTQAMRDHLLASTSSTFIDQSLECIFKPITSHSSNLVELTVGTATTESDAFLHRALTVLGQSVLKYLRTKARLILFTSNNYTAQSAVQQLAPMLSNSMQCRVLPLEEIALTQAKVNCPRLPSISMEISPAMINSRLEGIPFTPADQMPIVLGVFPSSMPSSTGSTNTATIFCASSRDVVVLNALTQLEIGEGLTIQFDTRTSAMSRSSSVNSGVPSTSALILW